MKQVSHLAELKTLLHSNDKLWLLLYKKGSEQSDCAFNNFSKTERNETGETLCTADVNDVELNLTGVRWFLKSPKASTFEVCFI